ncbi:hypothetical protein WJX75_008208 [Coccomyxa subellipsoidea]|uniref:Uncharacterized protein n=1 Tax=Coccomyxa subellipsoidea TaxID=248742 RepID=A0ABR2YTB2_9CHLO
MESQDCSTGDGASSECHPLPQTTPTSTGGERTTLSHARNQVTLWMWSNRGSWEALEVCVLTGASPSKDLCSQTGTREL